MSKVTITIETPDGQAPQVIQTDLPGNVGDAVSVVRSLVEAARACIRMSQDGDNLSAKDRNKVRPSRPSRLRSLPARSPVVTSTTSAECSSQQWASTPHCYRMHLTDVKAPMEHLISPCHYGRMEIPPNNLEELR